MPLKFEWLERCLVLWLQLVHFCSFPIEHGLLHRNNNSNLIWGFSGVDISCRQFKGIMHLCFTVVPCLRPMSLHRNHRLWLTEEIKGAQVGLPFIAPCFSCYNVNTGSRCTRYCYCARYWKIMSSNKAGFIYGVEFFISVRNSESDGHPTWYPVRIPYYRKQVFYQFYYSPQHGCYKVYQVMQNFRKRLSLLPRHEYVHMWVLVHELCYLWRSSTLGKGTTSTVPCRSLISACRHTCPRCCHTGGSDN